MDIIKYIILISILMVIFKVSGRASENIIKSENNDAGDKIEEEISSEDLRIIEILDLLQNLDLLEEDLNFINDYHKFNQLELTREQNE
jgi:hypothetical protein